MAMRIASGFSVTAAVLAFCGILSGQRPQGGSQPGMRLTELRGSLARRREYDLWLIRNLSNLMNQESRQGKILAYCMTTVYGAEETVDSAPETEYMLRADGSVLVTSGKPSKTPEQRFRDGQRAQLELDTGGGPVVQDCAGSLFWFGTWHDQPMPSDEKFMGIAAKAKADLDEIDKMLDPRLVENLPKPVVVQRASPSSPPSPSRLPVTDSCCYSK